MCAFNTAGRHIQSEFMLNQSTKKMKIEVNSIKRNWAEIINKVVHMHSLINEGGKL